MKIDRNFNPNIKWTFEEKEQMIEQKQQTIIDQDGLCYKCNMLLTQPFESAHRIPKHKKYIKTFGWKILNHPLNLPVTHKNCNSGVLLDPASHPMQSAELIELIKEDLEDRKWRN